MLHHPEPLNRGVALSLLEKGFRFGMCLLALEVKVRQPALAVRIVDGVERAVAADLAHG
jgi:hypothetical protein